MALSATEIVGIEVQPTLGTPVTPTILVPVLAGTFRVDEGFEQILDQGRRGPDALDFRAVQGVGLATITWEGLVNQGNVTEASVLGYLIDNLLGANSTSTQIVATGSYDHRLILGTTKEYLTLEHSSLGGANDRRMEGCRVTEIRIRFNRGEGALSYTVTLQGRSPTSVTAAVLTDNSQTDPHRGWEGIVLVDGASNTRLLSAEWILRRSAEAWYSGDNTQNFSELYLGPLEVVINSLVFDFNALTDLTAFRSKNQAELSTLFRTGTIDSSSERTFAIGSIVTDLGDGPAQLDNSNQNFRLGLTGRGLYTTSNGPFTSSGNAATAQNGPVQVQIVQPTVASY